MKKWIPKKGQKFEAIERFGGRRLQTGSPFKCTSLCFNKSGSVICVEAEDANGNSRIFYVRDFRFEAAED